MKENHKKGLKWLMGAVVPVFPLDYAVANDSLLLGLVMLVTHLLCLVMSAYHIMKAEDEVLQRS